LDIVNLKTNKIENTEEINTLNIGGNSISGHQKIANAFNKYFLTVSKSINTKQNELSSHNSDNTTTPSPSPPPHTIHSLLTFSINNF
jgi:hypothetical protein